MVNMILGHIFSLLFAVGLNNIHAEKILFVYPIATTSETHLFLPIAKALADKGHDVTILTPVQTKNLTNIEQIVPTTPLKDTDFMLTSNPMDERRFAKNKFTYLMSFDPSSMLERCHTVYEHKEFQKLYTRQFDLIFMSGFFNECLEALAYKLKLPYILMTSMPTPHWIVSPTGLRMPPSFVPIPLVDFQSNMNFIERFQNTIMVWLFSVLTETVINHETEKIYRSYLGHDIPGIPEIEKNISLVMSNSHVSLNFARPTMPDVIEVGGIHCRPAQRLPKDLNEFLTEAKDGVIYFSMGSVIKTDTFPDHLRKAFLNSFSKLKEKVLWKWDSESMDDLPPNVKLAKWLPQQDVLGRPNVKLFISHGGLLSSQETIYHGVPMLGIPVYVDQDINTREAENAGLALREEILELTEESLSNKINRLLTEPSFAREAKRMSRLFKDQLQTPLERATYWVEYVLRHQGAKHLRSPARDLNFIQYYSLDVVAALVSIIGLVIGSITMLICRVFCGKKTQKFSDKSNGHVKKHN